MDNHDQENNAELWQKFKSARETLFTQTDFFARYKAPASSNVPPAADPVVTPPPLPLTDPKSLDLGDEDIKHVSVLSGPCSEVTNSPSLRSVANTVVEWDPSDSHTVSSKGKYPATQNAELDHLLQSAVLSPMSSSVDHDLEISPNEKRVEAGSSQTRGKMNDSDTSDEVVLTGRRPQHAQSSKAQPSLRVQEPPTIPIAQFGREKKKKATPVKTQIRQMEATPEIKEELRRLTEEIRAGIGKRKMKTEDEMGINPAALKSARSGPGVDPESEVYQRIASRSKVDSAREDRFEFPEGLSDQQIRKLQWSLYKDDTPAYPAIEDGHVVLHKHPPPRKSTTPPPGEIFGTLPPCPTTEEIIKSIDWSRWATMKKRMVEEAPEHVNWRYNRSGYEPDEEFSTWLFSWLDSTMHICHYVDIYHEAFFDGTAHPDGMQAMFIPHLKNVEKRCPPEDDETKLHAYEIVDGYRWNYMNNKVLKDQATKNDSRTQYLSSPSAAANSPKANVYLRAVANGDISELLSLYNWYVHNAPHCVDLNPLDNAAMRQRVENSKTDQLPFIVAAERQTGKPRPSHNENILGFIVLTDFMGVHTIGERTAEIEIFVHPDKKGKGIGRCLMDKAMELCDPCYSSRGGYFFGSGKSSYRSLSHLIIAMSYPQQDPAEYHRVKEWLQKAHKFKEQGLLKGVARKANQQLNIGYLVRDINPFLQL